MQKVYDKIERHLRFADPDYVRSALEIAKYKQSLSTAGGTRGFSEDKEILSQGILPKDAFFGKGFDGLDLQSMTKKERDSFWSDLFKTRLTKLRSTK